jgi:hypothetical protein
MTQDERRAYQRAWYLAHKEHRRAYCQAWRQANQPTAAEKRLLAEASRERRKVYNARARAKRKAKREAE